MSNKSLGKRSVSQLVAIALLAAGLTGVTNVAMPTLAQAAGNIPMYRLFNPTTGEHFYTSSVNEGAVNVAMGGWSSEGIGWYAPPVGQGQPVYRLAAIPGSGSAGHLFTTLVNERDTALASRNPAGQPYWVCETGAGMPSCVGWFSDGPISIYRQFYPLPGPSLGQHNYTDDLHEIDVITTQQGWVKEGIVNGVMQPAWLGMSGSVPGDQTVKQAAEQILAPLRATTCQPAPGDPGINNADSIVSATINLNGSGSGFQGKVDLFSGNGASAVSFGIQYDTASINPAYAGKAAFLSENVSPGNNSFVYNVWCAGQLGQNMPVSLAYFRSAGIVAFYVAGFYIGSQATYLSDASGMVARVEANVKHNGDAVNVTFSNVISGYKTVRNPGTFSQVVGGPGFNVTRSPSSTAQNTIINITGQASAFGPGQDWDSNLTAGTASARVN